MSSSGGTSCNGGTSSASVSDPGGANRVTSCPRSVRPSANSATTHSMPPYPLGGTGYQGGAITAIRIELLGSVKRVTKPGYPPGDKPSNWVRQGGSASVQPPHARSHQRRRPGGSRISPSSTPKWTVTDSSQGRARGANGRLGQPAGSAAGPPGRGPGDPGQGGLAAEAGVEEVQGADLAGAELVVVDRLVVPPAAAVLGADLGQDLVEGLLAGHHLLALGVGVGGGQHGLADVEVRPRPAGQRVGVQHLPQLVEVRNAADKHVRISVLGH